MVAAFDYCLFGTGGAAPSIDTAMHGLVDSPHVDHLHPDSGIALATAADGESADPRSASAIAWCGCRGGDRASSSGWTSPRSRRPTRRRSAASSAVTASRRGATPARSARRARSRSSGPQSGSSTSTAGRTRSAPWSPASSRCRRRSGTPAPPRSRRSSAASPRPTRPQVGHYTDDLPVLDFLARERLQPLAALGTSCPDHFLRTKVRPMVLDLPPSAPLDEVEARLRELHAAYREDYRAYYDRHATAESPAMRGADPAIVLVPGVGMFSYGKDKQTARVAGEFYLNAINVMRGAEAISTYAPIDEAEKFRIEYWALEEAKLPADAEAQGAGDADRAGDRGRFGDRQGDRRAARRRGRLRRRLGPRRCCGRRRRGGDRRTGPGRRGRRRRERRGGGRGLGARCGAGLRRVGPGGQQRRAVDLETVAGHHRLATGICSTT